MRLRNMLLPTLIFGLAQQSIARPSAAECNIILENLSPDRTFNLALVRSAVDRAKPVLGNLKMPEHVYMRVYPGEAARYDGWNDSIVVPANFSAKVAPTMIVHELGHQIFKLNDVGEEPADRARKARMALWEQQAFLWDTRDSPLRPADLRKEAKSKVQDLQLFSVAIYDAKPGGMANGYIQLFAEEAFSMALEFAVDPENCRKGVRVSEYKPEAPVDVEKIDSHDFMYQARHYFEQNYLKDADNHRKGQMISAWYHSLLKWMKAEIGMPKKDNVIDVNAANQRLIRIFEATIRE